jgi:hypothetical protein
VHAVGHQLDAGRDELKRQYRRASKSVVRNQEQSRRELKLAQDRTHKRVRRFRRTLGRLGEIVKHGGRAILRRLGKLRSPKEARRLRRRVRTLPARVRHRLIHLA